MNVVNKRGEREGKAHITMRLMSLRLNLFNCKDYTVKNVQKPLVRGWIAGENRKHVHTYTLTTHITESESLKLGFKSALLAPQLILIYSRAESP